MGGADTVAANCVDQDLSRSVLPEYKTTDSIRATRLTMERKGDGVRVKHTVLTGLILAGCRVRRLWSATGFQGCVLEKAGMMAKRVVSRPQHPEKPRKKEESRGGEKMRLWINLLITENLQNRRSSRVIASSAVCRCHEKDLTAGLREGEGEKKDGGGGRGEKVDFKQEAKKSRKMEQEVNDGG